MHWSGAYTIWDKGVTEQWRYYISSKVLSAEELLHHARTEWSVESMHWLLDVHFDEDKCRIQSKNIQQNLNMLHKVALNIVRIYKRESQSKLALNGIMFRSLMNPHGLLPLLDKNWFPWRRLDIVCYSGLKCASIKERWPSGLRRRSWKPLCREVPGVRIPPAP